MFSFNDDVKSVSGSHSLLANLTSLDYSSTSHSGQMLIILTDTKFKGSESEVVRPEIKNSVRHVRTTDGYRVFSPLSFEL